MDKSGLIQIFNEIGVLLELKGENPFKVRAYYQAARILDNLGEDLALLIQEERLCDIPGFGEAITKKIIEWSSTGKIQFYEDLKAATPPGLLDFLRIPGLGPKKIQQIYSTFGIYSIEELEKACNENKLATLPGFGVKTQAKICASIQFIKEHQGEFLWVDAYKIALELREQIARHPLVEKIDIAGSLRRYKEVVHDIDFVIATQDKQGLSDYLTELPQVIQIIASGETKISVRLTIGINVDFRMVKPMEFPHALQHFTGSKEHNTKVRHFAKEQGYKVNEYGLFLEEREEPILCQNEAEICRKLGFNYITPELREDLGEVEAAIGNKLPDLVQPNDLKGIFHVHTTYSDGINPLRDMVEGAIERGFSYLGISDHSQKAFYAHGLKEEAVEEQFQEIANLQREFPNFKIFKGIEADILPSGELDYTPEFLAKFDFVIASIHSHFQMGRPEMTGRVLRAMDNPHLAILGHPTGRLLLDRVGYEINLEAIIEKAAQKGIIIEFNANPHRLDLDWRWCRKAKEQGVMIAINPDAHSIVELDLVQYGVLVARKGWLEVKDVFNTRTTSEIAQYFSARKTGILKEKG